MRILTALPLAVILAACATAPMPADSVLIETTVTYRERILPPPGHVLSVRVEDVSLADAPARVVASMQIQLTGAAPPWSPSFTIPADQFDPRHTYAVRADIRDAQGNLRFVTDTRHAVVTQGAGMRADIVLVAAR